MFEINYVNVLPPVLDDSQIYVKKEIGYSLNFVIGDDCFYHYDDEINKLVCDRKWKGGNGTIEQTWELIQYKLNYIGLPEGLSIYVVGVACFVRYLEYSHRSDDSDSA